MPRKIHSRCINEVEGGIRHGKPSRYGKYCARCRLASAAASGRRSRGNRVTGLAKVQAGRLGGGNTSVGAAKINAGALGSGNRSVGDAKIKAGEIGGKLSGGNRVKGEMKRIAGEHCSGNSVTGDPKRAAGMRSAGNRLAGSPKIVAGGRSTGNATAGSPKVAAGGRSAGNRTVGSPKVAAGGRSAGNRTVGSPKVASGGRSAGNRIVGNPKVASGGRSAGNRIVGNPKRRFDSENGRSKAQPSNFRTWRSLDVTFDMFRTMLALLHRGREQGLPRPWLRKGMLPAHWGRMQSRDLDVAILLMNKTRFCHPDRYEDRVSKEILAAMNDVKHDPVHAVAISLAVRHKQSKRGLADALARTTVDNVGIVAKTVKRARGVYRQTGITDEQLTEGVVSAARKLVKRAPFADFGALELEVGSFMQRECSGAKFEAFAARQTAADLCRMDGMVRNVSEDGRPLTSPLGPGAKAGWFHGERALRGKRCKVQFPKRLDYLEQTARCEYSKLVCRVNFPRLAANALYSHCGQ